MTTKVDQPERWLRVVGYEGLYEVSDRGRVRSLDRTVSRGRGTLRLRGRILRPGISRSNGHRTNRQIVAPCRDGKLRTKVLHCLMQEAFDAAAFDNYQRAPGDVVGVSAR